ncbi:MFS general substrate transporter [Lichtheimia hyalospora FSU 10163]|nr:MFS general substrate transporter [Lichtheimia hyalospora FSU 10163]
MSVVESSAGFGGFVLPIIMTAVSNRLGVQCCHRIWCVEHVGNNVHATAKEDASDRQSYLEQETIKKKRLLGLDLFKNTNYVLYGIVPLLQVLNQYLPPYTLPSYATYLGLSSSQASSLVSVGLVSPSAGQICSGLLADHIGPIDTTLLYSTLATLSALAIWMIAYTYVPLMIFAEMFCFFGSGYSSVYGPITISIVDMNRYPEDLSLLMSTNCPALFSPMFANLIESKSHLEPYLSIKILCGTVGAITALLLIVLKFRISSHRQ